MSVGWGFLCSYEGSGIKPHFQVLLWELYLFTRFRSSQVSHDLRIETFGLVDD